VVQISRREARPVRREKKEGVEEFGDQVRKASEEKDQRKGGSSHIPATKKEDGR